MARKKLKYRKRGKKGRSVPDDAFEWGPVRIERFGRYIRYRNTATPEQHAAYLKALDGVHKELVKELEKEVLILQKAVQRHDPVKLMHRAAYMLLPLFATHASEYEYSFEESHYLPIVEYLQYLIARTEPNPDGGEPSEEDWDTLWQQASKVFRLTSTWLLTRRPLSSPSSVVDQLRFMLDSMRLGMRVRAYPFFLADHLRTSLIPYNEWIEHIYGVSAETVVHGLLRIAEYLKVGFGGRYEDLFSSLGELQAKLQAKGYAVDRDASPEEVERTRNALEIDEFRELNDRAQKASVLALTPAVFDITETSSLPRSILSLLSVKPGESVLTSLRGSDHEDLSPLSTSILHYKPFLEVNDRFYGFYHSGLDDRIADIIEDDLFHKRPDNVSISRMAKKRSDRLETDSRSLLASVVKPDLVFQNLYYPNPDEGGGLTELDIMLGLDDILFLVEAKAGRLSKAATRGAPKEIESKLSALVIEGQRQSERAERYIRLQAEAVFYDQTGTKIIHVIRRSRYRRIFRIIVTREDLGWAGAQIAILSILDPNLSKSFPWHVSLNDLRAIADLFGDNELRFVHFLEQRLKASSQASLHQVDELEHVGLYNRMNQYHELPQGIDQMRYDASYMKDIDLYFREKSGGGSPEIPTQPMPARMRELVAALRDSHLGHRCEVGSMILSMSREARDGFANGLEYLDSGRTEGRQRSMRLPFAEVSYGLTVTYADDSRWREEVVISAAQMAQNKCERWIVLQLAIDYPKYTVKRIEVIIPGSVSELELAHGRSYLESAVRHAISEKMPGPNDRCPCASGRKFKKCHGKA
jgi:SEC-C motif